MAIKIGISGFRLVFQESLLGPQCSKNDIEIAGINVRNADLDYMAYMLKYDSTFGRFPKELGT